MENISVFSLTKVQKMLLFDLFPNEHIIIKLKQSEKDKGFEMNDDDIADLFLFIDDAIVLKGMVNQDYLNKTGVELQHIYDSLYDQLD